MSGQQGIDVAWPQGARYNWGQWAGEISFGMAKATEGTTLIDPDLEDNWDAMWWLRPDHRLPRFAYHFFHASQDAESQAEHLVATVKARGLLPGDNFVWDFEATDPDSGLNDDVAPDLAARRAVTGLQAVNRLAPGHRVLPYMDYSFAAAGHGQGMQSWFLWLASYGVSVPAVPAPWSAWTFWQKGDSPVDMDVFNGTAEQLLAFCRMPAKR